MIRSSFLPCVRWLFLLMLLFSLACGNLSSDSNGPSASDDEGEDDDADISDDDDASNDDDGSDEDDDEEDDDDDNDDEPAALAILSVEPDQGGASVDTPVVLAGEGFASGLMVLVGGVPAASTQVLSPTTAQALFLSVPLTDRGAKDVEVRLDEQTALLPAGFEYIFDEDPIVFVHGLWGDGSGFDTMIEGFIDLGYPADFLHAIRFSSSSQSNLESAYELIGLVDEVLTETGRDKVDMVAHSMGGLSSRFWIAQLGGADQVRDYVTLAGTQHGNSGAWLSWLFLECARELFPAYADQGEAANDIQYLLNGDPDVEDVDETPFGIEEGGWISWHAMWAELDEVVYPSKSACLNQRQRNDCSDPINVKAPLTFHIQILHTDFVVDLVSQWVREQNISKP